MNPQTADSLPLTSATTHWCRDDPTFTIFGGDTIERCIELAAQSPVVRFAEGGIIIASAAAADYAMHHPEQFSSGPDAVYLGSDEGLIPIQKDPPEHLRYRRMLDPLFAPRSIAGLEGGIAEHTNACIDRFIADGRCDVMADLAIPVPSGAILSLLGAPLSNLDDFLKMKNDIFRPAGAPGSAERDAQVADGARRVYEFFGSLIDERAQDPRDDMATHLARLHADGSLTRQQALDICLMLLLAGLDTISTTVTNMLHQLTLHDELRRRIVDDEDVIPAAVEELLRYITPIPTIPRVAVADVEVEGCPIRKGERVAVWFPISNWDESTHDDPTTIDFDRPVNRHFSFGVGKHRCLGSHLARLELQVILREWHRRVPEYRVIEGHQVEWSRGGREIATLPIEFPTS